MNIKRRVCIKKHLRKTLSLFISLCMIASLFVICAAPTLAGESPFIYDLASKTARKDTGEAILTVTVTSTNPASWDVDKSQNADGTFTTFIRAEISRLIQSNDDATVWIDGSAVLKVFYGGVQIASTSVFLWGNSPTNDVVKTDFIQPTGYTPALGDTHTYQVQVELSGLTATKNYPNTTLKKYFDFDDGSSVMTSDLQRFWFHYELRQRERYLLNPQQLRIKMQRPDGLYPAGAFLASNGHVIVLW